MSGKNLKSRKELKNESDLNKLTINSLKVHLKSLEASGFNVRYDEVKREALEKDNDEDAKNFLIEKILEVQKTLPQGWGTPVKKNLVFEETVDEEEQKEKRPNVAEPTVEEEETPAHAPAPKTKPPPSPRAKAKSPPSSPRAKKINVPKNLKEMIDSMPKKFSATMAEKRLEEKTLVEFGVNEEIANDISTCLDLNCIAQKLDIKGRTTCKKDALVEKIVDALESPSTPKTKPKPKTATSPKASSKPATSPKAAPKAASKPESKAESKASKSSKDEQYDRERLKGMELEELLTMLREYEFNDVSNIKDQQQAADVLLQFNKNQEKCSDPDYNCSDDKVCNLVGEKDGVCVDKGLPIVRNSSWLNYNGKHIVGNKNAIDALSKILNVQDMSKKVLFTKVEGKNELNARGIALAKARKLIGSDNFDISDFRRLPDDELEYIGNAGREFLDVPFKKKPQENDEVDEIAQLLESANINDGDVVVEEDSADVLAGLMENMDVNDPISEKKEEKFETVNEASQQEEIDAGKVEKMLKNIASGKKTDLADLDEVQQKVLKCLGLIA